MQAWLQQTVNDGDDGDDGELILIDVCERRGHKVMQVDLSAIQVLLTKSCVRQWNNGLSSLHGAVAHCI